MTEDKFNKFKPYLQDTCSLGIALFASFAIYYYNKYNNSIFIKISVVVCIFYSLFDLYNGATIDFWIHHIAQIVLCLIATIWTTKANDIMKYVYYCLLVEISSVFFSVRSIIRTYLKTFSDSETSPFKFIKQFQLINELLFFGTFMYTRLYLFNKHCILNPECYNDINHHFDFYMTGKMLLGCGGVLSIINLYWSKFLIKSIITKICGRDITKYNPDPLDPLLMEIEAVKAKLSLSDSKM
jgi:hypothetical protein